MEFILNYILIFLSLFKWVILTDVVLSFFNFAQPVKKFTSEILAPIYLQIQKVPHKIGFFDFTPLIALIGIDLLVLVLTRAL